MNNLDRQYYELARKVLDEGVTKVATSGQEAYSIPSAMIYIDMEEGFPLLTSKFIPISMIAADLEGAIKGIITKKWYWDKGCHSWDFYCSPKALQKYKFDASNLKLTAASLVLKAESVKDSLDLIGKQALDSLLAEVMKVPATEEEVSVVVGYMQRLAKFLEQDLGPIRGYKWSVWNVYTPYEDNPKDPFDFKVTKTNFHQLKYVINQIKTRTSNYPLTVCSWDISDISKMARPPHQPVWSLHLCDNKLHLSWHQSFTDVVNDLPYSMAFYGLLLELLSRECELEAGSLTGFFTDVCVYKVHEDELREQIVLDAFPLPSIKIESFDSIFSWESNTVELIDYRYFPNRPFSEII